MATDIAFAVGVLALLTARVPAGLKVLLLSLAIVDDIGAVLVIGLFYSSDVSLPPWPGPAAGCSPSCAALLRSCGCGLRTLAVLVWLALTRSGVHPTLAGVALGLLTPSRSLVGKAGLVEILEVVLQRLRPPTRTASTGRTGPHPREGEPANLPPLDRLQSALHPYVAFAIMPMFALANAGVVIDASQVEPVSLAVAAA